MNSLITYELWKFQSDHKSGPQMSAHTPFQIHQHAGIGRIYLGALPDSAISASSCFHEHSLGPHNARWETNERARAPKFKFEFFLLPYFPITSLGALILRSTPEWGWPLINFISKMHPKYILFVLTYFSKPEMWIGIRENPDIDEKIRIWTDSGRQQRSAHPGADPVVTAVGRHPSNPTLALLRLCLHCLFALRTLWTRLTRKKKVKEGRNDIRFKFNQKSERLDREVIIKTDPRFDFRKKSEQMHLSISWRTVHVCAWLDQKTYRVSLSLSGPHNTRWQAKRRARKNSNLNVINFGFAKNWEEAHGVLDRSSWTDGNIQQVSKYSDHFFPIILFRSIYQQIPMRLWPLKGRDANGSGREWTEALIIVWSFLGQKGENWSDMRKSGGNRSGKPKWNSKSWKALKRGPVIRKPYQNPRYKETHKTANLESGKIPKWQTPDPGDQRYWRRNSKFYFSADSGRQQGSAHRCWSRWPASVPSDSCPSLLMC